MTDAISRMDLLRGRRKAGPSVVRPPWAGPEHAFTEACTTCGDCVPACPEGIIATGRGGYPEIDYARAGCTFCGACLEACTPGALRQRPGRAQPLIARVTESCISLAGVVCRICGESCDADAISFRLRKGSGAVPTVDAGQCTGCGACIGVCPVSAVEMARPSA